MLEAGPYKVKPCYVAKFHGCPNRENSKTYLIGGSTGTGNLYWLESWLKL